MRDEQIAKGEPSSKASFQAGLPIHHHGDRRGGRLLWDFVDVKGDFARSCFNLAAPASLRYTTGAFPTSSAFSGDGP